MYWLSVIPFAITVFVLSSNKSRDLVMEQYKHLVGGSLAPDSLEAVNALLGRHLHAVPYSNLLYFAGNKRALFAQLDKGVMDF
jgi:hypothetical protein